MATLIPLVAEKRGATGKGVNRRLRNKGAIPAVLYGKGIDPLPLAVDPTALETAVDGPLGMNTLLELAIQEGGQAFEKRTALLKDYQIHPIKRSYVHADFVAIDITKPVKVRVPIEVTGRAQGVVDGGILQIIRRDLGIACLPTDIPASIMIDVTPLKIGASIHVGEVPLPSGARSTDEAGYTVATCVAPQVEKVAVAEAVPVEGEPGAVAAEGAEGEKAEGAAGAEGEKPAADKAAADKPEKKGKDKK
ncbi:MAG: 50S ribosomal protein L25 [Deltaproteobacteria bacterium]|nr:50S ribosomal protein L25 [Deltaproteobacteria bacterium]